MPPTQAQIPANLTRNLASQNRLNLRRQAYARLKLSLRGSNFARIYRQIYRRFFKFLPRSRQTLP